MKGSTIGRLAAGLAAATLMVAGTVPGTVAQSPDASPPTPDPKAAVYVTGTLGPVDAGGSVATAQTVTSSDPRLGGVLTYVENKDEYPGGMVGASWAEISAVMTVHGSAPGRSTPPICWTASRR